MTTPREALIEKLEKATGPDRELDLQIHLPIGFTRTLNADELARVREHMEPRWDDELCTMSKPIFDIPHYTASIDAALTLLDAGVEYEISTLYGQAHVSVGLNLGEGGPESVTRKDGNVPLAICQASLALRARTAV